VEQRLVVAGLELVGTDQEAVRVLLDLVRDLARREAVERGFCNLGAPVLVLARERDDGPIWALALSQVLADRVVVLDGTLDAVRDDHRTCLATDLVECEHLLVEVVNHDLSLEPDGVVVALDVAPQLSPCPLGVVIGVVHFRLMSAVVALDGRCCASGRTG